MEGGTERCLELAEAMKDELDTDFCNYLNYAIEQEEARLKEVGVQKPFEPPPAIYGNMGGTIHEEVMAEERAEQQALGGLATEGPLLGGREGVAAAGLAEAAKKDGSGGGARDRASAWRRVVDGVEEGTTPYGAARAVARQRQVVTGRARRPYRRGRLVEVGVEVVGGGRW